MQFDVLQAPVRNSFPARLGLLACWGALSAVSVPVLAQSPVPVESVATVEELDFEITRQIERLDKDLSTDATFSDQKSKGIAQAFGLLACLGQALAEHPEGSTSKVQGPALRDAALQFKRDSTFEQAGAALAQVKQAQAGQATGEHSRLHPWNKLLRMHPMMEEMNARSSESLKILKRPRGKPGETSPAVTWGLLAIAMKADTHEVKEADKIPRWNELSDEFRHAAVQMGAAIKAKDKEAGRAWFDKATAACDTCHGEFQD
jgi:hypothetical protein